MLLANPDVIFLPYICLLLTCFACLGCCLLIRYIWSCELLFLPWRAAGFQYELNGLLTKGIAWLERSTYCNGSPYGILFIWYVAFWVVFDARYESIAHYNVKIVFSVMWRGKLLKLVMLIIAEKIVVAIELFAQYYTINVSNKGVGVSMSQSNVMWWMYFVNLVGWLALSIRDLVPPQDPKF